jgi:hypothetical protein
MPTLPWYTESKDDSDRIGPSIVGTVRRILKHAFASDSDIARIAERQTWRDK